MTNGDLSPPRIISSGHAAADPAAQNQNTKSPVFEKVQTQPGVNNGFISSNSSSMSSPESTYGTSTSPLIIPPWCPYSTSPFLDKYEEAENSVCSYSQELRAKLLKHHSANTNVVPDFKPLSDGEKKWKLGITSLEGGKKLRTLLASCRLHPNEAVIELVGKYQLSTSFSPTRYVVLRYYLLCYLHYILRYFNFNPIINFFYSKRISPGSGNFTNLILPEPFAFFHQVPKNGMCISIDLRKYGNEARFVRRSCQANSEIRHIVGKGTLHVSQLFI